MLSYCRSIVCLNVIMGILDLLIVATAVATRRSECFVPAAIALVSIGFYAKESSLLLAGARNGGALRMATTLPRARDLPTMRRFAFSTHSHAFASWQMVGGAHVTSTMIMTVALFIVQICVSGEGLQFLFVSSVVRLLQSVRLLYSLRGFYNNAILSSSRRVLKRRADRTAYSTARATDLINRQMSATRGPSPAIQPHEMFDVDQTCSALFGSGHDETSTESRIRREKRANRRKEAAQPKKVVPLRPRI